MKKIFGLCLIASALLVVNAQAAHPHPCQAVKKACIAAGFVKGGEDGKRLIKDCVKPLVAGQTVAGVSISSEQLEACKAKHKKSR